MDQTQIISSIKSEDQVAIQYIYKQFGQYCISSLMRYRNVSKEEAEDLFVDAVMIVREKVLNNQILSFTNLKTYLYKVCEHNFLARLKSEKSHRKKLTDVEFYFYESDHLTDDERDFDQLLRNATKKAWEVLGEKCKDIINYFYVDKLRMNEIADLMGFSSPDVAKTSKSRCYKQFATSAKEHLEAIKNNT